MNKDDEKKQHDKKSLEEQAINKKQKASDGKEINPQVKQKQEKHQPRDNA